MSYMAGLIPCSYFPANFAVSSVVAEMNAEIAAAAAAQAAASSSAAATATTTVASTATASSAATAVASSGVAATTGSSAAVSASVSAFAAVALPVAVSVMAILAAGMVIDVVRMQRELKRCHKLTIQTVFTRREQLIDALFSQCGEDECRIYEEENGDLIVRYQLQDYFFRMDENSGFFTLEIINAQHPQDELDKINHIQLCYIEAVRRHTYERLMEAVQANGWTLERNETGEDGSQYISILV